MLAPALLWLVVAHWRAGAHPWLLPALATTALATALVPFAYLPLAAMAYPTTQFGDVTDLGTLWAHLRGARFTAPSQSYGFSVDRLIAFPWQLWDELFLVGLAAAAWGLRCWGRVRPTAGVFAALWLMGCFALPFIYVQGTEYDFWWMPLWGLLQVAAGVGLIDAWRRLAPRVPPRARVPALAAAALATLLPHLLVNARYCNRRGYHVPEDFAAYLLRDCEPGALYFAWSDQECSLTRYMHEVRGLRPDLVVLQGPVLPDPWYLDWMHARYPTLKLARPQAGVAWSDPEWAAWLMYANRPRPAYGSRRLDGSPQLADATWIPVGGLWKLDWSAGANPTIDPAHWEPAYRNPRPFDLPLRLHHALKPHAGAAPVDATRVRHSEEIRRFHQQAWLNRARWHLDRQEHRDAVECFVQIDGLAPQLDNPGLWFEGVQVANLAGRADLATRWCARVPDDSPLAADRSLILGQLAMASGAPEAARVHYAFVRQRAPAQWAEAEPKLRAAGLLPP